MEIHYDSLIGRHFLRIVLLNKLTTLKPWNCLPAFVSYGWFSPIRVKSRSLFNLAVLNYFKRFCLLTNYTEILRRKTSRKNVVKIDLSVWSPSRSHTLTNKIFFHYLLLATALIIPNSMIRCTPQVWELWFNKDYRLYLYYTNTLLYCFMYVRRINFK